MLFKVGTKKVSIFYIKNWSRGRPEQLPHNTFYNGRWKNCLKKPSYKSVIKKEYV